MRKILMLAAMLIAPGLAPASAEAGDRSPGFRHFAPPPFAQRHFPHHRKPFHFGHHRSFKPFHFGQHRSFKPRHFGHPGVLLKFHNGGLGFRFGTVPHVKPHHFRHRHRAPAFTFAPPSHVRPWGFSQRHHKSWRGRSHRHW